MKKLIVSVLALVLFASALIAAAKPKEKTGTYENKGGVYSVGDTIRVVGDRKKAELDALRDAIARLAAALEKKGVGNKKELSAGIENAVTHETELAAYKLGKVRVESVLQERWEAPEGKEAWSAKVKISVRFK